MAFCELSTPTLFQFITSGLGANRVRPSNATDPDRHETFLVCRAAYFEKRKGVDWPAGRMRGGLSGDSIWQQFLEMTSRPTREPT
jgi:hypothetical protein